MKTRVGTLFIFLFLFLSITQIFSHAGEIPIGVLTPLTGRLAPYGQMAQMGYDLAVDEINSQGGINGDPIVLKIRDTRADPVNGANVAESLIREEKVVALVGGCSSSATLAAITVAEEKEIPFLITTASADKLTEMNMKYAFRLNLPTSEQDTTLFEYISRQPGIKRACILRENTRFGWYMSKRVLRLCRRARIMINLEAQYERELYDFTPIIYRVKEKAPDLLVIICKDQDMASDLLGQLSESDWTPKIILGVGQIFHSEQLYQMVGDMGQKIISSALWVHQVSYEGAENFADKCLNSYGLYPDYHAAQAYAALQVIADALTRTVAVSPTDLRGSLANTNLMTIYGPVSFVSYGKKDRQNRPPTYVLKWANEDLSVIWPRPLPSIGNSTQEFLQ